MYKEQNLKVITEMVNDAKKYKVHCDDCEISEKCVLFDNCVVCSLYNKGYRKQVWHKVKGGYLPCDTRRILIVINVGQAHNETFSGFYDKKEKRFFVMANTVGFPLKDVIAWTEFPEYEE